MHLGMADYEARAWSSWHHHMALVALAHMQVTLTKRDMKRNVPELTLDMVLRLLRSAFARPQLDTDTAIELVEYHLERNRVAHDSHRKSWLRKHKRLQARSLAVEKRSESRSSTRFSDNLPAFCDVRDTRRRRRQRATPPFTQNLMCDTVLPTFPAAVIVIPGGTCDGRTLLGLGRNHSLGGRRRHGASVRRPARARRPGAGTGGPRGLPRLREAGPASPRPDPKSPNQTEQLLAEPEVQNFFVQIDRALRQMVEKHLADQKVEDKQTVRDVMEAWRSVATHPGAIFLSKLELKKSPPDKKPKTAKNDQPTAEATADSFKDVAEIELGVVLQLGCRCPADGGDPEQIRRDLSPNRKGKGRQVENARQGPGRRQARWQRPPCRLRHRNPQNRRPKWVPRPPR